MSWTQRLALAVRRFGGAGMARPGTGRIVMPRREDSVRDYPSSGLTPSRLVAVLREADDGSLATSMQLFEEMEEKDAHLFSVANTRRLAVTGLAWHIDPAPTLNASSASRAEEAAEYCIGLLNHLESFDEVLQHLSLALGRNIALAEIVWEEEGGVWQPVDLAPVDFTRITFDDLDRPRVVTDEEPVHGIEPPPNKFIIHTPHSVSGHPQRGGLLRVTAMVYLAKNLALKDWMIFTEVFGMPIRVARYDAGVTAEEKRELLTMLESLGSTAAGIFSRAVELQVIDVQRGSSGPPYQSLIEFLNREMSKAWLGQTLTTDISGQSGSVAASRVHEQVRRDLLLDDLRKEARTIRRDLLGPMTRLKFGDDAPVPVFRREGRQPLEVPDLVEVLDGAVNRLGIEVPDSWARRMLGLPEGGSTTRVLGKPGGGNGTTGSSSEGTLSGSGG